MIFNTKIPEDIIFPLEWIFLEASYSIHLKFPKDIDIYNYDSFIDIRQHQKKI